MESLLKYSGLVTKVKAMQSHMLTEEDYTNMANMKKVKDVALYLKQCSAYSDALSDINENDIHRGDIEKKLIYSMYKDYEKIYKFTDGTDRNFLNSYFVYFEIEILKLLLRTVFDSRQIDYELKDFETFFNEHSVIDVKKLSKARNLNEFIDYLKDTDYYNMLSVLYNVETPTLFDAEIQLDLYYFNYTWKLKNKYLTGQNNKAVTETFGARIDLLNILWIYRAKINYMVDKDTIYTYIIPIYYKLKKNQIRNMIEAKDFEEFYDIVKTTYYSTALKSFEGGNAEKAYFSFVSKMHKKAVSQSPMSLAPIRYFMYHKKIEIANITRLIEGVRYSLKPNEIIRYLNMYDENGGEVT